MAQTLETLTAHASHGPRRASGREQDELDLVPARGHEHDPRRPKHGHDPHVRHEDASSEDSKSEMKYYVFPFASTTRGPDGRQHTKLYSELNSHIPITRDAGRALRCRKLKHIAHTQACTQVWTHTRHRAFPLAFPLAPLNVGIGSRQDPPRR